MLSVLQKDYSCGFIEAVGRIVHSKEEKLLLDGRRPATDVPSLRI